VQFICPLALSFVQLLLQVVVNNLIQCFSLTVALWLGHCRESGLTSHAAKVVGDLRRIKLSTVVKDHCSGTPKQVMTFFQINFLTSAAVMEATAPASIHFVKYFTATNKYFMLTCGLRKWPEDVHSSSGE